MSVHFLRRGGTNRHATRFHSAQDRPTVNRWPSFLGGRKPAGWPRVVAYPRLPRIRTCAINAYGSSSHGLAYMTTRRVNGHGRRERITPQQPVEHRPREKATPSSACQPFLPDVDHRPAEPRQRTAVAGDPEVGKVTTQFLAQRLVLRRERLVPVEPTPLGHLLEGSAQAIRGRLPLHHPVATPRATPVMSEA